MDLTAMTLELRSILGETVADFWTATDITSKLNEGQRRFNQEEKWPWLLTEVTNGSLAASATSFALLEGVNFSRNINVLLTAVGETRSYKPKRVDTQTGFDLRMNFDGTTSANPMYYYLVSEADADADGLYIVTARFIPTPSRAFTVSYLYYRTPAVLVGATDRLDCPAEYEMAAVHWAAHELWLKELNGKAKSDEQLGLYYTLVNQARTEFFADAVDAPLVAGSEEPQPGMDAYNQDQYTRLRIPDTLGP